MTIKKSIAQGFGRGELYDAVKHFDGAPFGANIIVGEETIEDTITVNIQLTDYLGNNLTNAAAIIGYVSSDSAGLNVAASGCSADAAIGTNGSLAILKTKTAYLLISETDGSIDIVFTDIEGISSFYFNMILANGKIITSSEITFTFEE